MFEGLMIQWHELKEYVTGKWLAVYNHARLS